jgi:hypothetical protein
VRIQHGLVYIKLPRRVFPGEKRAKSNGVAGACGYIHFFPMLCDFGAQVYLLARLQVFSYTR